jgi:hypothetical protein
LTGVKETTKSITPEDIVKGTVAMSIYTMLLLVQQAVSVTVTTSRASCKIIKVLKVTKGVDSSKQQIHLVYHAKRRIFSSLTAMNIKLIRYRF